MVSVNLYSTVSLHVFKDIEYICEHCVIYHYDEDAL